MRRHCLAQVFDEVGHCPVNPAVDVAQELLVQLSDVHPHLKACGEWSTRLPSCLRHRSRRSCVRLLVILLLYLVAVLRFRVVHAGRA